MDSISLRFEEMLEIGATDRNTAILINYAYSMH